LPGSSRGEGVRGRKSGLLERRGGLTFPGAPGRFFGAGKETAGLGNDKTGGLEGLPVTICLLPGRWRFSEMKGEGGGDLARRR